MHLSFADTIEKGNEILQFTALLFPSTIWTELKVVAAAVAVTLVHAVIISVNEGFIWYATYVK